MIANLYWPNEATGEAQATAGRVASHGNVFLLCQNAHRPVPH